MTRTRALAPLKALWTSNQGQALPLPPALARLYGRFYLPEAGSAPHVFSNFVTTLDGVVSLRMRGHANGRDISGCNDQDRLVMGILRAVADVVVVGAGTLAADRQHVWTSEAICPAFASDFRRLRKDLGKSGPPLNVIVSGSGSLDLRLPVFASGAVQVMVITTTAGAKRLAAQRIPAGVDIRAVRSRSSLIAATTICREIRSTRGLKQILLESGPRLTAGFYQQGLVSEQFLTLAPQLAGRKAGDGRPGMVMGRQFAPHNPLWGRLVDVRQAGSHLFLRYSFT
jgi:riboflavin biosynthesis pyrimidine reductase